MSPLGHLLLPASLRSVDDLENIGDLEKYIDQSAIILLFLSKGYFQSRNWCGTRTAACTTCLVDPSLPLLAMLCVLIPASRRGSLREVEATIVKLKPYLFVHEADPAKGGAPLEALAAELQNEMHRNTLFDGRRVTVWHRIKDFQLVSLLQIAEDMLKLGSEYGGRGEVPLYIPGSQLDQKLAFPTRVTLYASPNNPGAAEAALEMTSIFSDVRVTEAPPGLGRETTRRRLQVPNMRRRSQGQLTVSAVVVQESTGTEMGQAVAREVAQPPSHFLLYLSQQTFMGEVGETFAEEVRRAHAAGHPIAMIHETDPQRHGCEFANFFQSTPQDLIDSGLYKALAVAFMSGEAHRSVSRKLLAKALGAVVNNTGVVSRLSQASYLGSLKRMPSGLRISGLSLRKQSAAAKQADACPGDDVHA